MSKNLTPSLIKDINPGSESSNPGFLGNVNGNLLFTTFNRRSLNIKLWKTDGSESGTVLVEDFGSPSFPPRDVTNVDGAVYFLLNTSFTSLSLYRSDGTESGTFSVDGANLRFAESISNLTSVGDTVFYSSSSSPSSFFPSKLIKIDNNNIPVRIQQNPESGGGRTGDLRAVGNTLFFADNINPIEERTVDIELWKSDGTDGGTVVVKDINPTGSSNLDLLGDINGTLFFSADNGTNGRELWKSDGTETGTVLIKDINPGSASSISPTPLDPRLNPPSQLTDVNGTAFFVADNGTNGNELWKSDGTNSGTSLVKDIFAGSQGSTPDNLTNVNGTLFFTVNDGSNGTELWKSDGSETGTTLVADINPGANSSNPNNLTNVDGILYFSADDGTNGTELWKSDGTASGTVLVSDINPGSASSNPENFTELNGEIYFSADDGVNGRELWGLIEVETNKDLILGGDSNDVLLGKEQDNIIDGLKGDDTLTGGDGKDKFVLSDDFGSDVITDFTLGEDEIINATNNIVLTVASVGDAFKVAFSNTGDVLQVNLNGNNQTELKDYLLNIGSNQDLPY